MKISASVYSNKNDDLKEVIESLDVNQVDLFHIDCKDDLTVFEDISQIRAFSKKPVDLHIITEFPSKFYPYLERNPVEYVAFQYEDLKEPLDIPSGIQSNFGLAITSHTDIDVFEPFAEKFSFILIMATVPGESGGAFDKVNFAKIRKFKQKYPDKRIHVDGGVNAEVSFIIRNMGVDAAVSGSYLFKENQIGRALMNLKAIDTGSHYLVKDFMRNRSEIPVLLPNQRTMEDVLLSIENYSLGFTILAGKDDQLEGVISNADMRRGLIKNVGDIGKTKVEDMVNRQPVVINENKTVTEMIGFIKKQKFPVNFLPVTNENGQITGVVTFFNLIKGEM